MNWDHTTKELLLAAQRAMVPQGHKAMPGKALRKLGALIEAPWNDEAAPDVLRRIRRAWDEMHATRTAGVPASDDARDAARYRWLREQHWNESPLCVVAQPRQAVKLGHDCPALARLDAAVDEQMAARGVNALDGGQRCDEADQAT